MPLNSRWNPFPYHRSAYPCYECVALLASFLPSFRPSPSLWPTDHEVCRFMEVPIKIAAIATRAQLPVSIVQDAAIRVVLSALLLVKMSHLCTSIANTNTIDLT